MVIIRTAKMKESTKAIEIIFCYWQGQALVVQTAY